MDKTKTIETIKLFPCVVCGKAFAFHMNVEPRYRECWNCKHFIKEEEIPERDEFIEAIGSELEKRRFYKLNKREVELIQVIKKVMEENHGD